MSSRRCSFPRSAGEVPGPGSSCVSGPRRRDACLSCVVSRHAGTPAAHPARLRLALPVLRCELLRGATVACARSRWTDDWPSRSDDPQTLWSQRNALASTLPADAPSDYWLVASEALVAEARSLVFEEIRGNTDPWDRIDHPTWRRMVASSEDLITQHESSRIARVLAPLLARLGFPRTALETAPCVPGAHVVLRNGQPRTIPGSKAVLFRLGIQPTLVESLTGFLGNPPWSTTRFDLRSIDPTLY